MMMRAVSASTVSMEELAIEEVSTAVELADKNTIVLPFGKKAVAFTCLGALPKVPLLKPLVSLTPATETDEDTERIGNIADEDGVSGHTVATGT